MPRLPEPLRRLRSAVAQALGLVLRAFEPATLRLQRFACEVRARSLLHGPISPGVQFIGPIHREGVGRVRIGPGTRIGRNVFFETYGDAEIVIGARVTINDGCVLVAYAGIAIGDDTMIGEYTSLRDANHGMAPGTPVHAQPHVAQPVSIGRDVWLGRGVVVLKGVSIGDGAVAGANSVVTKSVDSATIVAGVPARVLGRREA